MDLSPPEWCSTAANFYNWRVVNVRSFSSPVRSTCLVDVLDRRTCDGSKKAVTPLYKLISTFPDFQGIRTRFELGAKDRSRPGRKISVEYRPIEKETGVPFVLRDALPDDSINPPSEVRNFRTVSDLCEAVRQIKHEMKRDRSSEWFCRRRN